MHAFLERHAPGPRDLGAAPEPDIEVLALPVIRRILRAYCDRYEIALQAEREALGADLEEIVGSKSLTLSWHEGRFKLGRDGKRMALNELMEAARRDHGRLTLPGLTRFARAMEARLAAQKP